MRERRVGDPERSSKSFSIHVRQITKTWIEICLIFAAPALAFLITFPSPSVLASAFCHYKPLQHALLTFSRMMPGTAWPLNKLVAVEISVAAAGMKSKSR